MQDLHVELRPDIYIFKDIVISEERYKELLTEGIIFVGENKEKIITYAVCFVKNWDNPGKTKKRVMFIDQIGNDTNFRKCGIGKTMMQYIINYAKEIDCDRIELGVSAGNKNAIAFYEHLGMKEKSRTLELDLKN